MTRAWNDKNRHPAIVELSHDVSDRSIGKMGALSINRRGSALQILECVPQLERQADGRRLGRIEFRGPSLCDLTKAVSCDVINHKSVLNWCQRSGCQTKTRHGLL